MSEGITYDPLGTVTVTFDDKTYRLRRPKFGQYRYFTRQYYDIVDSTTSDLQTIGNRLTALETEAQSDDPPDDLETRLDEAREEMKALTRVPLHERTAPVIAAMFTQVGDPLPKDTDEWPAWLVADSNLLPEILKHWRTVPKASGGKEQENSG